MLGGNDRISPSQLRWFGLSLAIMLWCVGGWIYWRYSQPVLALISVVIGAALLLVYYVVPGCKTRVIQGFRWVTWPIQFVVSVVLLAVLFYGVMMPIGLVMRGLGRDPLIKRPDRSKASYWSDYPQAKETRRYFRLY